MNRRRERAALGVAYVVLVIWLVVTLFPVAWTFLESIKLPADVFAVPPKWLFTPSMQNYQDLADDTSGQFVHT